MQPHAGSAVQQHGHVAFSSSSMKAMRLRVDVEFQGFERVHFGALQNYKWITFPVESTKRDDIQTWSSRLRMKCLPS